MTETEVTSEPVRELPWQPVARAMSQFGGGAIASGLLSAAATKIIAARLGPPGMAVLGTLQQWRETALVGATLNGQTAIVQGASRLTSTARREYLRTSMCLFGVATFLVSLVLLALPSQAASISGLGAERAPLLRWLVAPVGLAATYIFLNGILSALGATGTLAKLQLVAPAALALLAYPATVGVIRGADVLLPILLAVSTAAAVGAVAVALSYRRAELTSWFHGPGHWWTYAAARHFFALSGSMLASGLASNWALVAVRAQILRTQGLTVTGQFDASWAIGLNLSTLLLGSIQAYYLPLLARARTPAERATHITGVFRVAVPAAAVLIVGLAAFKPFVLRCLYSAAFGPAVIFLRWTLLGNYFKVTSWILSVPMLACSDAKFFLATELIAWGVFSVGTVVLAHWWEPAESASVAFALMYVVHLAISSTYVRRHGFRWRDSGPRWLTGLALVLAASAAYWSGGVSPILARANQLEWCAGAAWIAAALGIAWVMLRRDISACAE